MRNFAIFGVAFPVLIGPAMAADMVPPYYKAPRPVMPWSGCYIGADLPHAAGSDRNGLPIATIVSLRPRAFVPANPGLLERPPKLPSSI
jgi:hypothetical protein